MTDRGTSSRGRESRDREDASPRERELLSTELARSHLRDRRENRRVLAYQALLFGCVLLGWWFLSGRLIDRLFVSDPWSVAKAFVRILLDGTLWFHLRYTLAEITLGYCVGAGAGVLAAATISLLPWGEPIVRPFVMAGYAVPKIALAPLIIVWFGIGILPKIVLAAAMVFFIVYFNTLSGLRSVSPELLSSVKVMTGSRSAVLAKVILPNAAPFVITALRITLPAALIGAIIGELMSSHRGMGYLLSSASTRYDTPLVFAGILSLLVFVLLMNALVSILERFLLRWRPAANRSRT